MRKAAATVFVSLSISAYGAGVSDVMSALGSFEKGLESKQLLLRHQVARIIQETKSQLNEETSLKKLKENKDFFRLISSNTSKMKISKSSKTYIRKEAAKIKNLIESATLSRNNRQPAIVEVISTRESAIEKLKSISDKNNKLEKFKKAKKFARFKQNNQRSIWLFVGSGVLFLFGLITGGKMLFRKEKNNHEAVETGGLKLKMFNEITTPVVFVDSTQNIFWSNKSAKGLLALTKGSSFFMEEEVEADPLEDKLIYRDEVGKKYFVETKEVKLSGESYNMLMFLPVMASVAARSFRKSETSLELSAALELALEKYNYLFASNSIPVAINQTCAATKVDDGEQEIFQRLIYLGYQMAKDVTDTRVNITIGEHKSRGVVQMDIKGLKSEDLDFGEKVYLSAKNQNNLGDLWTELEISLAHREARVFMFDSDKYDTEHFSIVLSFNRVWENKSFEENVSPRNAAL